MKKYILLLLAFISGWPEISASDLMLGAIPEDRLPAVYPYEQKEKPGPALKEVPFIETAPLPAPTFQEKELGMILFSRPLTSPIWAETRPLPRERIRQLSAWGAPGQFVLLNFGVYPLADLQNLKIRIDCPVQPELSRVGYWNIGYPYYNSRNNQYRRMPEYMVPMNTCNAPKEEAQRFILSFRLPESQQKRTISGTIKIWHQQSRQAAVLPFELRILPIRLKKDPDRHYSAYYYSLYGNISMLDQAHRTDPALLYQSQTAEFRLLRDYGFTSPPNMYMRYDSRKDRFYVDSLDKIIAALKEAGFDEKNPIMLTGCSEWYFIKKYTGREVKVHYPGITELPDEFFSKIDCLLEKFLKEARDKNYPPFVFNPVDEPSVENLPWLKRLYGVFHKHGARTVFSSAAPAFRSGMHDAIDIYTDGNFRYSYQTVSSDVSKEYWAYPNNIAYQIRDPQIMCQNGRMTYGFGFWKSGYRMLMPWTWRRSRGPSHLTGQGGNLLLPSGRVLVGLYWACFREGIYDLQYLYTLRDAVCRHRDSADPACRRLLLKAQKLLAETWNEIPVMADYSAGGIFSHEEYDARRLEFAEIILELQKFAETNPTAIPEKFYTASSSSELPAENTYSPDNQKIFKLKHWLPMEKEASVSEQDDHVRMTILVDHQNDGTVEFGQSAKYPCGWPRMIYRCPPDILSRYEYLSFQLKVDSNRDGEANEQWPMWMEAVRAGRPSLSLHRTAALQPATWHSFRIPLKLKKDDKIIRLQFGISENQYPDKAKLDFHFKNMQLTAWTQPTPADLICPGIVSKLDRHMELFFKINGPVDDCDAVRIRLEDMSRIIHAEKTIPPQKNMHLLLPLSRTPAGNHVLSVETLRKKQVIAKILRKLRVADSSFLDR